MGRLRESSARITPRERSCSTAIFRGALCLPEISVSDLNAIIFAFLERNTGVFVLKAGRALPWPDSYPTFQRGIFSLASPEQQPSRVYPGWKAGAAQSAWLPRVRCCPSCSPELLKHLSALRLRWIIPLGKADLSTGPHERVRGGLRYVLLTLTRLC